jgi:hypothetical protein
MTDTKAACSIPTLPPRLSWEVSHGADVVIREQFKTADMRTRQYGDRSAAVDRGDELRGEVQVEIYFAMRDSLVDLRRRWRIDKADVGKAFGVQQLFGNKLGGVVDRGGPHEADSGRFEGSLGGRGRWGADHARRAGQ